MKESTMFAKPLSAFSLALALAVSAPLHAASVSATAKTTLSSLSTAEKSDLLFMREEEKLARDVYLTLYETWGLPVFSNIASSEQSHMDAVLKLLRTYRLTDPAAGKAIGEFSNSDLQSLYGTLMEKGRLSALNALQVGGIIEETDMRDLVAAIERADNADLDSTYENLLCGSRNHLRAFASTIESMTRQPYTAQVIAQDEVDAIVSSPQEKCGDR
ncbi:MAG: hypothetical protein A2580_15045 [Hydrogenophilales bacterium RIFOXYD1_FULL_62_11]|nr:MAG: hypothetical protein A2580_15045 [Hydrogenophilales bacterium RIFOXYD1_FULL_62_11]